MKYLDEAVRIAGGVGELAKAIGMPNQNSISMWRRRGKVPLPWRIVIATKYGFDKDWVGVGNYKVEMDWQSYVADALQASGFNQIQLADAVQSRQTTISDILTCKTRYPRADLAFALISFGRKHGLSDPLQTV